MPGPEDNVKYPGTPEFTSEELNKDAPKIAQFTVINGRKIPKAL